MIPKKIHYCWFGKGQKSELILKCIASWRKHLPDYEIVEWNEDNFDLNSNLYVKQAYESRKWAFVTDYVRLWVLYSYGGVYVDSDVEVFKSLDDLLVHEAFTGFEKTYAGELSPITATMGSTAGHIWIKKLLDFYIDVSFINPDGTLNLTTNTITITNIMVQEYGLRIDDSYQILPNDLHIYPSSYLCNESLKSYTVHHFGGSWKPWYRRLLSKIKRLIYKIFDL